MKNVFEQIGKQVVEGKAITPIAPISVLKAVNRGKQTVKAISSATKHPYNQTYQAVRAAYQMGLLEPVGKANGAIKGRRGRKSVKYGLTALGRALLEVK